MAVIACPASLPFQLCDHWNIVLYLLPSLILAMLFRLLTRMHAVFFLFYLSGTILHELAHFLAGALTNARPAGFSVWPRRENPGRWILGSVSFKNIRWYNAAFVGLAPIATLAAPPFLAAARLQYGVAYGWHDIVVAVLLAPIYLSALPSREDVRIALRSWPYAVAAFLIYWLAVN